MVKKEQSRLLLGVGFFMYLLYLQSSYKITIELPISIGSQKQAVKNLF